MMEENVQEDNKQAKLSQLGARFKSARETMHISQREAASRLNLNLKYITMMESGNYEDNLPTTFIRGYLRSYARLLNVMEDEINAVIEQQVLKAPLPATPAPKTLLTTKPKRTDQYIHWITYGVVLTLVVMVGIWWSSHAKYSVADVPSQPEAAQATVSTPATNAPTAVAPSATSPALPAATNSVSTPAPASATASPAPTDQPAATGDAPAPVDAAQAGNNPAATPAPTTTQPSDVLQPMSPDKNAIAPFAPTPSQGALTNQDAPAVDADGQPKHKHSKHDLSKMLASPEPGLEVGD